MEEKKFKNRREQADYYAKLRGWGPLTEEDKIALDDAVRMVTNLDSKPRYATASPSSATTTSSRSTGGRGWS